MHELAEPRAERMPWPGYEPPGDGRSLIRWSWAVQRLKESRRYWLASAGANGLPHLAAVWGVWSDGVVVFGTGRRTRKAVNLGGRPECAIATESGAEAVIVEGAAVELGDPAAIAAADAEYQAKYGSSALMEDSPLFAVRPRTVVAIVDGDGSKLPTRWRFQQSP